MTYILGEVRLFAFNYKPRNFEFCNGQTMPIYNNQELYSILGTQFGGDGRSTFNLPNLQGRSPIHQGEYGNERRGGYFKVGMEGGTPENQIREANLPKNLATIAPRKDANIDFEARIENMHHAENDTWSREPVPLDNRPPYLTMNYCICVKGEYPERG